MKINSSDKIDVFRSKILKPQENNINNTILHKNTTTTKKVGNLDKKFVLAENNTNIKNIKSSKTKNKKIENHLCHTQKIKNGRPKADSNKISSKNSSVKNPIEALKINNNVVKNIFNKDLNEDLNKDKNMSSKNNIDFINKLYNELNMEYNNENLQASQEINATKEDKEKAKEKNFASSNNDNLGDFINERKKAKKDNIIDISDNEDDEDTTLIINYDDDNENEENKNNNNINNTIFPKLSSNPFLSSKNQDKNNKIKIIDLEEKNKIFFSPNINKKGGCIQQAQLLYKNSNIGSNINNNNLKSPTKTTVISINSSTTQNSNDTINNINIYNLDTAKRKKINLNNKNSNIYLVEGTEGKIYNEKNLGKNSCCNINVNSSVNVGIHNKNSSSPQIQSSSVNNNNSITNNNVDINNYNLLFNELLTSVKNKNKNEKNLGGEEGDNLIKILQKIINLFP